MLLIIKFNSHLTVGPHFLILLNSSLKINTELKFDFDDTIYLYYGSSIIMEQELRELGFKIGGLALGSIPICPWQ